MIVTWSIARILYAFSWTICGIELSRTKRETRSVERPPEAADFIFNVEGKEKIGIQELISFPAARLVNTCIRFYCFSTADDDDRFVLHFLVFRGLFLSYCKARQHNCCTLFNCCCSHGLCCVLIFSRFVVPKRQVMTSTGDVDQTPIHMMISSSSISLKYFNRPLVYQ